MITLAQYLQENFSKTNYNGYTGRIKKYQQYNRNHQKGTLQHVLDYIQSLRKQGKNSRNLHTHLHSIKVYYTYLQHTGKRKDHPCKDLYLKDRIDKRINLAILHTKQDLLNYLEATPQHKKLLVSVLIHQILKVGELVNLKVKQINLQKATIQLQGRIIPLEATQILAFKTLVQNKKPEDIVFTTATGKAYPLAEINAYINYGREKIKQITPNKIRQSAIKELLKENDLRIVQTFVGHKTSATTEQYRTDDFDRLKLAVQKKHPLS